MTKIIADFKAKFGKDKFAKVMALAGHHAAITNPESLSQENKLIFSLLEMIGYDCFKYEGNQCSGIMTETELKAFLIKHKKEVKKFPADKIPDYISLVCGRYDFIFKRDK